MPTYLFVSAGRREVVEGTQHNSAKGRTLNLFCLFWRECCPQRKRERERACERELGMMLASCRQLDESASTQRECECECECVRCECECE